MIDSSGPFVCLFLSKVCTIVYINLNFNIHCNKHPIFCPTNNPEKKRVTTVVGQFQRRLDWWFIEILDTKESQNL